MNHPGQSAVLTNNRDSYSSPLFEIPSLMLNMLHGRQASKAGVRRMLFGGLTQGGPSDLQRRSNSVPALSTGRLGARKGSS